VAAFSAGVPATNNERYRGHGRGSPLPAGPRPRRKEELRHHAERHMDRHDSPRRCTSLRPGAAAHTEAHRLQQQQSQARAGGPGQGSPRQHGATMI